MYKTPVNIGYTLPTSTGDHRISEPSTVLQKTKQLKGKPKLRSIFINLVQRQLSRVVGIQTLKQQIYITCIACFLLSGSQLLKAELNGTT